MLVLYDGLNVESVKVRESGHQVWIETKQMMRVVTLKSQCQKEVIMYTR